MTSENPARKNRPPSSLADTKGGQLLSSAPSQPLYANLVELHNASNASSANGLSKNASANASSTNASLMDDDKSPVPADRLQSPVYDQVSDKGKTRPKSIGELPSKTIQSPTSLADKGQAEFSTFLTPISQNGQSEEGLSREVTWFHDVYSGNAEKVLGALKKGIDPNIRTNVSIVVVVICLNVWSLC